MNLTDAVIKLHDIARFVDRNVDASMAKEIRRTADKLNKHSEVKDDGILENKKTTG
tara:strand:- start:162 stop:329 length:168 start_codon:yes stop_codon:yes gene_type:complete